MAVFLENMKTWQCIISEEIKEQLLVSTWFPTADWEYKEKLSVCALAAGEEQTSWSPLFPWESSTPLKMSVQSPEKWWQMASGKEKSAQKTVKTKTRHYLTLLQLSAASAHESVNEREQDRLASSLECPNYMFCN